MPEYLAPGVFIEEHGFGPKHIQAVSTTCAAIVGPTLRLPDAPAESTEPGAPVDDPRRVASFAAFADRFGDAGDATAASVRAFFDNGGEALVVQSLGEGPAFDASDYRGAFVELEADDDVCIVFAPGAAELERDEHLAVVEALRDHCERTRYRVGIVDARAGATNGDLRDRAAAFDSSWLALYAPWVRTKASTKAKEEPLVPPSGFVAGVYARVVHEHHIAKAPAGVELRGALGFERDLNEAEQEVLSPLGVNLLRTFPGRGHMVWGARTLSSDPEWKYISVRRTFAYLEHSIDRGLQWVVFEPNTEALWTRVRQTVEQFLRTEWRAGVLMGLRQEEAFFVRCDRSTMTENDIDNGRLICEIGVAPLRPAEFVIFRIGQKTADG